MPHPFTEFATVTDGSSPRSPRHGQPVIGLSVNIDDQTSRLHEAYIDAVMDAGGIPVLIPASTDAGALREAVERIDGLILTGGSDVDGRYFGEATLEGLTDVDPLRDAYDFLLLRLASDRQLPVFGICRGAQVINIAFGGTLWQDIPSQLPGTPLSHSILKDKARPAHTVVLEEDSRLAAVFGKTEIDVNSRHHQAIKEPAPGFRITATAPDGVAEAIEGFPLKRIWGVQWHPENMASEGGDEGMKALFEDVVHEAALFRQAKAIHGRNLIADSHCDTPMLFGLYDFEPELTELLGKHGPVDFGRRSPVARVDLAKMAEGRLDAVFEVAYIPQGDRDERSCGQALEKTLALLAGMRRQVEANAPYVGLARTFAQADALKAGGRKAIFLGVENGYAIGRDLSNIERLQQAGAVYITLCHNGPNDLCDSAAGEAEHGGLSDLGRQAVRRMNALGVVIDVSHAAETTFYDVLKESAAPVVATHSSARALCDHPRNLTDNQLRALAAAGGVAQVCLYEYFLKKGGGATLIDAVDHIDHIVRLVGPDHAGIGSDFVGGGGIPGCDASNELINITVELLRRGYAEVDIAKIWGGNLRRVTDLAQNMKTT